MAKRDPRVDAYIEKAADFAKPILRHLRAVVHAGCPDVEETMKWSFPHFDYEGILCSMAAFKAHCTFGFWNVEEVMGGEARAGGMGQFGRVTSLRDLPSKKVLVGYVRQAAALKDAGVKPRRAPRKKKPELPVPDELAAALALSKNRTARETFEGFPPSHRRETIEYIVEAKRPETRARRVARAVEFLAQGKPRNWRYR